jgi:hypothetical protein
MFTYRNKLDEDMDLIGLHVSDSFLFHISYCKTLEASWDKLDSLFGKFNEFLVLQLKVNFHFLCMMSMGLLNIIFPNLDHWL